MKLFKHKRPFIIILIALLFLFATKAYYDTNSVEIKHYQIENSSVGEVLRGLKVAHLSDLHIKNIGATERKILEILEVETPDLIFITGDFINFEGPYEPFTSFLTQLKPPFGVYSALGNTEYSNENGSCTLCHEKKAKSLKKKQNYIFLRNASIPLRIDGKTINIIGVDDPVDKKNNLRKALENTNSEDPSILLAHSPEVFEEASRFGIDFLLCGHNHGGQIFITKLLRKFIPLDPALEFLEGFYQKGKLLMYVSRGIGTSYLPFRFGVKPEITFFTFTAQQHGNTAAHLSWSISNTPPITIFTGFNFSNLVETFNIFKIFDSLGITSAPPHRNTATQQHRSTATQQHRNTAAQNILFDFESESELGKLNWECHKWFELSEEHATSGKHSLRVTLPPGQYPGINFEGIKKDWSKSNYFKMDIFNPSEEEFNFHVRIDDNKSGLEYANRFDKDFNLKPGPNHISIPMSSIQTNLRHRSLDLKRIKGMTVFLIKNTKPRELYLDNIRLE